MASVLARAIHVLLETLSVWVICLVAFWTGLLL